MISSNGDIVNQRQCGNGGISTIGPVPGSINMVPRAPVGGNLPPVLVNRNIHLPPPIIEQTSGKLVRFDL